MMSAMRCMQQEGVSGVSLCLIPCLRCDQPSDGDSRVVRRGLSFWWRYGNWLFDMRGIYHYKSRFRPEFRPLYVAASPRITFGSMRSCLRSWEVCRPKPAALLRNIGEWSRKLTERKSLAKPGQPVPTATPTVAASVKASKPVLQLNGNGKSTATIPTATGPTSVRPTVSLPPHDGKIMPDLGSVESVPFEGIWTIES